MDDINKENAVLERQRATEPKMNPTNQLRLVQRTLRNETEISNRDDAISYVHKTNRQMNTFSRTTPTETDRFISDNQWDEIHVQFPQACEPCTRAKSRYKKNYTVVIHKTPGNHTNPLRDQMKFLCQKPDEIDDIGNMLCMVLSLE